MGRRVEIPRHLHRQHALGRELRQQAREQRRVILDPLQGRGRIDQCRRLRRLPALDIAAAPGHPRRPGRRRLGQHLRRFVEPDHLVLWPALGDRAGMDAGAAAEVPDRPGRQLAHLRQEIEARPQPLVREFQVLSRVPGHAAYNDRQPEIAEGAEDGGRRTRRVALFGGDMARDREHRAGPGQRRARDPQPGGATRSQPAPADDQPVGAARARESALDRDRREERRRQQGRHAHPAPRAPRRHDQPQAAAHGVHAGAGGAKP